MSSSVLFTHRKQWTQTLFLVQDNRWVPSLLLALARFPITSHLSWINLEKSDIRQAAYGQYYCTKKVPQKHAPEIPAKKLDPSYLMLNYKADESLGQPDTT